MIKAQIIGGDAVERALLRMAEKLPGATTDAALAGATIVEGRAKAEGFRSKGEEVGEKTTKSGKTRKLYAALGAPIADKLTSRTGNLRASIRSEAAGRGRAAVGPTAKYGAIHEFGGTIDIPAMSRLSSIRKLSVSNRRGRGAHSRIATVRRHTRSAYTITMPARPYLRPAFEKHRETVRRAMVKRLQAALSEAMQR